MNKGSKGLCVTVTPSGKESGIVSFGSTLRSIEKSGSSGKEVQQPSAHGENGTKLFRVAAKPTANLIEGEEGCSFDLQRGKRKRPFMSAAKNRNEFPSSRSGTGQLPNGLQLTINADLLGQFAMRCFLIGLIWSHMPRS